MNYPFSNSLSCIETWYPWSLVLKQTAFRQSVQALQSNKPCSTLYWHLWGICCLCVMLNISLGTIVIMFAWLEFCFDIKIKLIFLYKALHGGACLLLFNCTVGCHQMSDAALGIVPGCVGRKQWELTPLSLSVMDNSWMTSRQFNGLLSWQCQSVGIMDNRNLVDRHLNWLAGLKWVCICVWDLTGIKVIFAALP